MNKVIITVALNAKEAATPGHSRPQEWEASLSDGTAVEAATRDDGAVLRIHPASLSLVRMSFLENFDFSGDQPSLDFWFKNTVDKMNFRDST